MRRIVFFDGHCLLCNGFVNWVMDQDQFGVIQFAPLQGTAAKQYVNESDILKLDTVYYLRSSFLHSQSNAILWILYDLGGWKRASIFFMIIPKFLRNFIYQLIAKNRYRLFGRRDTCRLPSPEEKNRILP